MTALSFRTRLTLRWTLAFGCVLALTCLAIYAGTRTFLQQDLDAQLRTLAGTELASATDGPNGLHFHEFPVEDLAGEYAGKFVQHYDDRGTLLAQSSVLEGRTPLVPREALSEALAGHAPIFWVSADGRPGRMVALTTRKDGRQYVVAVGLFADHVVSTLSRVTWLLLAVSVGGLLVTAGVGYVMATRALQPIAHVTERASRIARGDFSARLDRPEVDDEMGRMTTLLNDMLDRLNASVESNRRFASDASHELRSPLTAMLGEIDVTLKRPRSAEDYRESLAVVRQQIQALAAMTEELMILVRAQEGHAPPASEVDLEPLVREVAAALRPLAADRHVHIEVSPMHGALVYADRLLLARVVDNLLRNAVQYNRPDGSVVVAADVEDANAAGWRSGFTVLRVTDTGHGIPPDAHERVFERFYRTDRSRNRRTGGAGLGLSIAAEVVRLFSGTIRVVESTAQGTVIEVRLPGSRAAGTAAPQLIRSAAS